MYSTYMLAAVTVVSVTNHASDLDVSQFPLHDTRRQHSKNRKMKNCSLKCQKGNMCHPSSSASFTVYLVNLCEL
jgi:hypothetical protein